MFGGAVPPAKPCVPGRFYVTGAWCLATTGFELCTKYRGSITVYGLDVVSFCAPRSRRITYGSVDGNDRPHPHQTLLKLQFSE